MTTEAQREQQDRKEILRNDLLLRQGSTFHAFAQADAELPGRFGAISKTQIVGQTAIPTYPAASHPFQRDPVPDEEPLGYRIDAMPDLELTTPLVAQEAGEPAYRRSGENVGSPRNSALGPPALPAQATDAPVVAHPLETGASFSSGDLTSAAPSTSPSGDVQRGVGSPPFRRFR
jgi:hypothetical protein